MNNISETKPPELPGPPGYLSETDKHKFTIHAGILGAVFFLFQMVLPFIVMFALMPTMMTGMMKQMRVIEPNHGTYWNEHIWFVTSSGEFNEGLKTDIELQRIKPGSHEDKETVASLDIPNPWLLNGNNRLWVISPSSVSYYKDGEIHSVSKHGNLGDIGKPFFYQNAPCVIEQRPSGLRAMIFTEGEWRVLDKLKDLSNDYPIHNVCNLQIVTVKDAVYLFLKFGNTLYYAEGFPPSSGPPKDYWQTVTQVGRTWTAMNMGNEIVVFCKQTRDQREALVGLRKEGNHWNTFYRNKILLTSQFGAYPTGEKDRAIILTQFFPSSFRVIETAGSETVSNIQYGSQGFFPNGMMSMMFIPHIGMMLCPLILAFILSSMMNKYRKREYTVDNNHAQYASIAKRALAQILDLLVLGGPIIAGWLMMMQTFMDPEHMMQKGPAHMFEGMGVMLLGVLWIFVGLLIYSFFEGRWGWTPGKWVMGLRVRGTDLKPCGFGRAFIRNLLKALDGFFNFMVGILLIALTENWQRVGDMAARTIVIDIRKDEEQQPARQNIEES